MAKQLRGRDHSVLSTQKSTQNVPSTKGCTVTSKAQHFEQPLLRAATSHGSVLSEAVGATGTVCTIAAAFLAVPQFEGILRIK